jgi:hypothetical protein
MKTPLLLFFHFRSWDDICKSKDNGGLGIRDIQKVNHSLIINAAWNIATGKNNFLSSILKAKYYPNTSFWNASNSPTKSIFWSSITQVKDILHRHCIMQIHNGQSSIWSTPWCEIWESIYDHIKLPTTVQRLPQSVADLWNPQTRSWNNDLISQIFDDQATQCIIQTPIVPSDSSDIIRWKPARKGVCTTKEAFRLLNNQQQVQLPQQGAKGITPQALQILKRT